MHYNGHDMRLHMQKDKEFQCNVKTLISGYLLKKERSSMAQFIFGS